MDAETRAVAYCGRKAFRKYLAGVDELKNLHSEYPAKSPEAERVDRYVVSLLESCRDNEICRKAMQRIFTDAFGMGHWSRRLVEDTLYELQSKLRN